MELAGSIEAPGGGGEVSESSEEEERDPAATFTSTTAPETCVASWGRAVVDTMKAARPMSSRPLNFILGDMKYFLGRKNRV